MNKILLLLLILSLQSCSTLCTKIIGAEFKGEMRTVTYVYPGSPADKAGIKPGDELAFKYDMETHWVILRHVEAMVNGSSVTVYEQKEFIIHPVCSSEVEALRPTTWDDTAKGYQNPKK